MSIRQDLERALGKEPTKPPKEERSKAWIPPSVAARPKYLVLAEVTGALEHAHSEYHRVQGHQVMEDVANCAADDLCDQFGDLRIALLKMLEDTT